MSEERFKGWFHAGLAVIFAIPLGYNLMRLAVSRKPRHAINVALYSAAVAWELAQVRHHWRGTP